MMLFINNFCHIKKDIELTFGILSFGFYCYKSFIHVCHDLGVNNHQICQSCMLVDTVLKDLGKYLAEFGIITNHFLQKCFGFGEIKSWLDWHQNYVLETAENYTRSIIVIMKVKISCIWVCTKILVGTTTDEDVFKSFFYFRVKLESKC